MEQARAAAGMFGAVLIGLGALAAAGAAALAAFLTFAYLEWENAADGLFTIAMITGPVAAGGLMLVWLGGVLRRVRRREAGRPA